MSFPSHETTCNDKGEKQMKLELLVLALTLMLTSCIPVAEVQQVQQPQYVQEVQQEQIVFPEGSRRYDGVRWIEIHSEKEFWKQIYSAPNVIVMFSATWCEPCKIAKHYWENQSAPAGWKFVYWQANNDKELASVSKLARSFCTKQGEYAFPVLAAIQNAKVGKQIKGPTGVLKGSFVGLDETTINLKKWLSVH
ncbi:MAG: thioredoxin family protein [Patescibacteria group bacterium]|jgi:thiol-disulfide isomerase/thioredoxin